MRICFITTEFISESTDFDGGLANYIYKIAKTLITDGHEVQILLQSKRNERFTYEGISVQCVKVDFNNPIYKTVKKITKLNAALDWILGSYGLNKRLKQLSHEFKIDIVQYSSFRATALFRPRNIPTIVRLSSFHPYIGEAMGVKKGTIEDRFMTVLEQNAVKKATKVFGPSKVVADLMQIATKVNIEVIETPYLIPNITDEALHSVSNELKGKKYILFIGKLSKHKGADLISEIIYKLLSRNKELIFAFAGRDAGYKDIIISNSKEFSNRLLFLGRVDRENLFITIKNSLGVILPSKMDNLPNACIEAMSMGKIVVGTDGASFEQLITDGINGFLFENMNSDMLIEKIEKLVGMLEEDRNKIENKAIERIKLLDPQIILKQTLNLYDNAIKEFNKQNTTS